jgi:hypothetical protein
MLFGDYANAEDTAYCASLARTEACGKRLREQLKEFRECVIETLREFEFDVNPKWSTWSLLGEFTDPDEAFEVKDTMKDNNQC